MTVELFKQQGLPFTGFVINPTQAMTDVCRVGGIQNVITIDRQLDPALCKLNNAGFFNGHVPFSASIAFISLFAAALTDCNSVVVSNEASSNERTTQYLGHEINHQYSKSYEFEKNFREYVNANISKDIEYLSILRPLNELQISKIFSGMKQYFSVIRSCNRGQKTNTWCCHCPKCLSTYVMLFPFVGTAIKEIFPENLYEKESLFPLVQSLIDSSKVRPFECVGTREENIIGLSLAVKQYGNDSLPPLLQKVYDQYLVHEQNIDERTAALLSSWNESHFLPEKLEKILHKEV
jgi:UDP-N-acetyl-alpha-D-muramoyl-L-alanyl-L-glutamate epimerase